MSKVIGKLNEDGSVASWPELNMGGGTYHLPISRQVINATTFVVLPPGFDKWDEIEVLKAQHAPKTQVAEVATETVEYRPEAESVEVSGDARKRVK